MSSQNQGTEDLPIPLGPALFAVSKIGGSDTHETPDTKPQTESLAEPLTKPRGPFVSALPSELEIGTDSSDVSLPLDIDGSKSHTLKQSNRDDDSALGVSIT
jgi:hypothetical protein